jgi:hypothetical protein
VVVARGREIPPWQPNTPDGALLVGRVWRHMLRDAPVGAKTCWDVACLGGMRGTPAMAANGWMRRSRHVDDAGVAGLK